MSGRRRSQGLFGAVRERLRARSGDSGEAPPRESEPTTAERLDDALARLRDRVPPEEEPPDSGDREPRK